MLVFKLKFVTVTPPREGQATGSLRLLCKLRCWTRTSPELCQRDLAEQVARKESCQCPHGPAEKKPCDSPCKPTEESALAASSSVHGFGFAGCSFALQGYSFALAGCSFCAFEIPLVSSFHLLVLSCHLIRGSSRMRSTSGHVRCARY